MTTQTEIYQQCYRQEKLNVDNTNPRIRHATQVLQAIEAAVLRILPLYAVTGDDGVMARNQARIDNAVRIYCAADVAATIGATGAV